MRTSIRHRKPCGFTLIELLVVIAIIAILAALLLPEEKVFACPSDPDLHLQVGHAFTSYTFSGYEVGPTSLPRITGKKLAAIKSPAKAVLAGEFTGFFGGSWHPLRKEPYRDARSVMSFVDAHVAFIKIYWNGVAPPTAYEPTPGYDYDWDGE